MSCGTNPDYRNICSDGIGDIHTIPNLCTSQVLGPCDNISTEWVYYADGTCDCDRNLRTVTCTRDSFAGDPATCCGQNLEQYPTDPRRCWSDSTEKRTCAPQYRGPSQSGCRELFYSNCVYNPISQDEYSKAWSGGFCNNMVANNTRLPSGDLNNAGLPWINEALTVLLEKAFPQGFVKPGLSSSFQDQILNLATEYPEAFRDSLDDYCKRYNRIQLESNINAVKFCGCYLPDQEYAVYETLYAISRTCDPFCANTQTIPLIDNSYKPDFCKSNVCLIDNVTVNLVESEGGNIGFTQVCGGCGGSTACNCTISNVSVNAVEASLGNINLEQECLGALKCYTTSNGVSFEVPCQAGAVEEDNSKPLLYIFILLGFFLLLLLGLIFLYLFSSSRKQPVVTQETVYKSTQ